MKINYPAVLAAAVAHFIIGGLWYGLLFSNKFVELIGWSPERLKEMESRNPTKQMVIAFLTGLILVYVLAHFIRYTGAWTALQGLETAFWLWIGFVATTQLATVIFEERPLGLYLLNIGYQFVGCAVGGIILAVWQRREVKEVSPQPA